MKGELCMKLVEYGKPKEEQYYRYFRCECPHCNSVFLFEENEICEARRAQWIARNRGIFMNNFIICPNNDCARIIDLSNENGLSQYISVITKEEYDKVTDIREGK